MSAEYRNTELGGTIGGKFYPQVSWESLWKQAKVENSEYFEYGEDVFITESGENVIDILAALDRTVYAGNTTDESGNSTQSGEDKKEALENSITDYVATAKLTPKVKRKLNAYNIPTEDKITELSDTDAIKLLDLAQDALKLKSSPYADEAQIDSIMQTGIMEIGLRNKNDANYYVKHYSDILLSLTDPASMPPDTKVNEYKLIKSEYNTQYDMIESAGNAGRVDPYGIKKSVGWKLGTNRTPSEVAASWTAHLDTIPPNKIFKTNSGNEFRIGRGGNDERYLIFKNYADGLEYDLRANSDAIEVNGDAQATFLMHNPDFAEWSDSYERLKNISPSSGGMNIPAPRGFINDNNNEDIFLPWDSSDPNTMMQFHSPERNAFPTPDKSHFWSEPRNNLRRQYLDSNPEFLAAKASYIDALSSYQDTDHNRYSIIAGSNPNDDIYMDGDNAAKIERINQKYKDPFITALYQDLLMVFDETNALYYNDIKMLSESNKYIDPASYDPKFAIKANMQYSDQFADLEPGSGLHYDMYGNGGKINNIPSTPVRMNKEWHMLLQHEQTLKNNILNLNKKYDAITSW